MMDIILSDIRAGIPIIITDHPDREGEGDLMIAAQMATVESLAFFARHGRGLTCLPCKADRLDRLKIPMAHSNKLDKFITPFANSIDAANDISTGVSAADRKVTIDRFVSEESVPEDFAQPGHLFPLRAREGLLKERQGHTEASVVLCELAGLVPVAVIVEIMNDDGSMTKGKELVEYAWMHGLNSISIDEIIEYMG
jgi:3,4-dihydroxy 2-butanone 4-phosphate synthase / GTP cyclohydrolase II